MKNNIKVTSHKRKDIRAENELEILHTFDSSLFIGQSYFGNDRSQNF